MKVILIERYPPSGRMTAHVLERLRPQYQFCGQAYTAEAGEELVRICRPDVVILEPLLFGHLPETQLQNLNRLRQIHPDVKLIVVTSSGNSEHIRTAVRAGVSDYLYKPTRWKELLTALDRCCGAEESQPLEEELTPTPLPAELADEKVQDIVRDVQRGDEAAALTGLEQYQQERGGSFEEKCVRYMEIATQIIHLPDRIDHVPEDLIVLYQDFIKHSVRHRTSVEQDRAMELFLRRSAGIFNRFSRDQGYHQIQEAMRFVDEHLDEELSLRRLSNELYISTTYFSRLFRAKTGKKFSEYLADRRIEQAKVLLVTTDRQVSAIARQVGYADANSFARLFKAHTGKTPAQYRKSGGK